MSSRVASSAEAGAKHIRRRVVMAAGAVAVAGSFASPASAADFPLMSPSPISYYRWEGVYVGGHVGYAVGETNFGLSGFPTTSLAGTIPPVPSASSATTQGFVGGLQAGFLHQIDAFVFGVEGDVIVTSASGTATSNGTALGLGYKLSEQQDVPVISTLRGRIGYAPNDRYMVYASGGLAIGGVKTTTDLSFSNGDGFGGSRSDIRTGWAAGGGIEYALSPQTSVTLDYLHFDLGSGTVVGLPNGVTELETHTSSSLRGDIVRVGMNYRFGNGDMTFARGFDGLIPQVQTIETEFGMRYWYSTGRMSKNLFDFDGTTMLSRLTYSDLTAGTAEAFARFDDRSSGLFAKAFVGAGGIGSGNLQDEDFPPGISPYSSTNSAQHDGSLLYFAGDIGYNVLWGQNYRVSPFIGYFHQRETVNAYGCAQTATNPDVCAPAIPDSYLTITEDAHWNAVRLGAAADVTWNRFKLAVDAAWLPYVSLASSDSHWLRMQPIPGNFGGPISEDGTGFTGVQLEAILSYLVTPNFSVGVGGRYWRFDVHGNAHFEGDIIQGAGGTQAIDFSSQRFGAFVQGAYKY
jgi:opacity protein-like surface antigen